MQDWPFPGVGCVLLRTGEHIKDRNFYYFAGLDSDRDFSCALVMKKNSRPVIFASALEYKEVKKRLGRKIAVRQSHDLARELDGILTKKVGINYSSTTVASLQSMRKRLKKRQFVDVSKRLSEMRAVKSRREILRIKQSCRIAEELAGGVPEIVKTGMTEKDAELGLKHMVRKAGVRFSFSPIIAFGDNSSVPHHVTGKRKLKRGDVVLVDIGVIFDNYCSDITRMFFAGRAGEGVKNVYQAVKEAEGKSLSVMVDGVKSADVFNVANDILKKRLGAKMIHSLGHGIGMEVHDHPEGFSEKSRYSFKENMVLAIEPAYYGRKFGVRIEDDVVVGRKKCTMLTKSPNEIVEI